jgi:hypothetical protein
MKDENEGKGKKWFFMSFERVFELYVTPLLIHINRASLFPSHISHLELSEALKTFWWQLHGVCVSECMCVMAKVSKCHSA